MKNKKFQIVKLNLFPYDIMFATAVSVEDIKRYLKKFGIVLDEEKEGYLKNSGLAHTLKLPNRAILVYFIKQPNAGLVAHEVFHAVWMILNTMGVDPSVDSEEVYAYMIEYIVNQYETNSK